MKEHFRGLATRVPMFGDLQRNWRLLMLVATESSVWRLSHFLATFSADYYLYISMLLWHLTFVKMNLMWSFSDFSSQDKSRSQLAQKNWNGMAKWRIGQNKLVSLKTHHWTQQNKQWSMCLVILKARAVEQSFRVTQWPFCFLARSFFVNYGLASSILISHLTD